LQHRAENLGANWLTDEHALGSIEDKELEFELEIRNIVLDKLTETVSTHQCHMTNPLGAKLL